MTIEDLVKLVDEYTDLWDKHDKSKQDPSTELWHMVYSSEERTVFYQRIQEIEKQVQTLGFDIGRDEQWMICLYRVVQS